MCCWNSIYVCISFTCRWKPISLLNRKVLSCQEFISKIRNQFSLHNCSAFLSSKVMATLGNKRKLAAVSRETQASARNSQSQNKFVPGMTEKYITQVSDEIEGKVTKRLSQKFSWSESCILGALSKLHEFLLMP